MGRKDLCRNTKDQTTFSSRTPNRFTSVCSSWFDIRVLYVRVVSCSVEDSPDILTIWFPVRSIEIALEINGARISPSENAGISLRRDRSDSVSESVTYVSTDNVRTSGSVSFELYDRTELLVSGSLKQSVLGRRLGWKMECNCEIGVVKDGSEFVRVRYDYPYGVYGTRTPPRACTAMEVCVVGKYLGSPVILTQTVQLSVRRSRLRCTVLDSIPEDEECCGKSCSSDAFVPEQMDEQFADPGDDSESSSVAEETEFNNKFYEGVYGDGDGAYGNGEYGEVSWFNAGVRVGVGIGLGMCVGVGLGVGLLVRTYNATARSFRRGIL